MIPRIKKFLDIELVLIVSFEIDQEDFLKKSEIQTKAEFIQVTTQAV
jgi:hypothetical protein